MAADKTGNAQLRDPPVREAEASPDLARRLLHAHSPDEVAAVLVESDPALSARGACVLWSSHWPRDVRCLPPGSADRQLFSRVAAMHQSARSSMQSSSRLRVLCDDGDFAVAVLYDPAASEDDSTDQALVEAAGSRMAETMAIQRLQDAAEQAEQAEKLQRALFAIADMSASDLDMPDMLRGLHRIIAELMYAENFYIALYDRDRDTLRFVYYVDTVDTEAPAVDRDFPMSEFEQRLTGYLIRDGKPLMGTTEELEKQISGPLAFGGADSIDWLGVPMMRDGQAYGALVVQTYVEGIRFTTADMALLAFVAEHVLTALERKQVQEELERRVEERTLQLAEANRSLTREVAERERGERLQAALYQVAALAGTDRTQEEFLASIHAVVSRLLNAENFYVALLSADGKVLEFPYVVDQSATHWAPRPLGRGLSEYVMRTGHAEIVGGERAAELISAGEIGASDVGVHALCWLGVPLRVGDQAIGVVAVQSYTQDVGYDMGDAELLTFVANQLANSLQRRREVAERERRERLQSALYQIAALAATEEDAQSFYARVHEVIADLLEASNFYIALLAGDGQTLEFPYFANQREAHPPARAMGRGLTEYVIRTGQPQLVDAARATQLIDEGEIDPHYAADPVTQCWLGAPLSSNEATIGIVAVQSHEDPAAYDDDDAELLKFVASQLSSSLQRRRDAEALQEANQQLEARVEERTRELTRQIEVREQVEAQLKHQVMHDALTGLPNRIYLRDRLERAIARARRSSRDGFGLLYIDVDRFKLVNDSLGHLAGDEVLCEVARRLTLAVREPDVVARLSGDEFAILLENVQFPGTATKVAQRVLASMEQPIEAAGQTLQTGTSIGIAIGNPRHTSPDELLRDADTALYRAKTSGRNRFVLFDDDLHHATMDQLLLEQQLRGALSRDEFLPYYQPLVRLSDGGVIGYEALLRWNHPQRGILTPGDFLTVAEESGLIEAIDWKMFKLAFLGAGTVLRKGEFVTINVSPRLFQNDTLDSELLALLEATGLPPEQMRIEVTEGTLLGDPEAVEKVLHRLREACVEAALDDFGTGYSSLGYVHRFPLKMLKIDRSFVEVLGREQSPRNTAVVGAILALSKSLGLDVVAEGIETKAQHDALLAMGCVYGQGFLFGRPQPAEHWRQRLEK